MLFLMFYVFYINLFYIFVIVKVSIKNIKRVTVWRVVWDDEIQTVFFLTMVTIFSEITEVENHSNDLKSKVVDVFVNYKYS